MKRFPLDEIIAYNKATIFGRLTLQKKIKMKLDPEVFQVYSISVSLLVIKTMFMAFLTGKARLSNKVSKI